MIKVQIELIIKVLFRIVRNIQNAKDNIDLNV